MVSETRRKGEGEGRGETGYTHVALTESNTGLIPYSELGKLLGILNELSWLCSVSVWISTLFCALQLLFERVVECVKPRHQLVDL